jgi:uncharacterized membrane protein YphA (DoxX/SURF4 family)
MRISATLDRLHARAKANNWLWLFSLFCRVALAAGFFPAGLVKIFDERFASGLSVNHPMGSYLEALHHTGYYYTFIGIVQVAAAIMLLIPRTVTLGAFLYFPVILNICILTYALRFDGSLFTAPLMTLANLFLLGWNYEKWKYILPFNRLADDDLKNLESDLQASEVADDRGILARYGIGALFARFRNFLQTLFTTKFPYLKNFPYIFFAGVFFAIVVCVIGIPSLYRIKPRNTEPQCLRQFKNSAKKQAGEAFCTCIHQRGEPLDKCMLEFDNAPADAAPAP